ncbi:MAG: (d)CMP kinase [Chitinophagales bacterium]|nr:(d)CMP kinase [Chitinophagales bacterium]MCZ2394679.1 (d)CMP kinase [Chitinophagales bacterium]
MLDNKKINIAIDGYSGCGKSTTAKAVASKMGYTYIDTGAMYRAVTLYFQQKNVNISNLEEVETALRQIEIRFKFDTVDQKLHTILNGIDVENLIRTPEVAAMVSPVAALSAVRKELVAQQRIMGMDKGVVMDGRDIGTVVFPDAECKFFLVADIDIRTERRIKELALMGIDTSFEDVKSNLLVRDNIDSHREDSPLRKAEDAIEIDTSYISIQEQIEQVMEVVREVIAR